MSSFMPYKHSVSIIIRWNLQHLWRRAVSLEMIRDYLWYRPEKIGYTQYITTYTIAIFNTYTHETGRTHKHKRVPSTHSTTLELGLKTSHGLCQFTKGIEVKYILANTLNHVYKWIQPFLYVSHYWIYV